MRRFTPSPDDMPMMTVSPRRSLTRTLPRALLLVALCAAAACDWAGAFLPADAERLDPPAVFARWWAMTEACSGRTGDLNDVRWYRVPGSTVEVDGRKVAGFWGSRGNRIVLPDERIDEGDVVRHEMLHALLQQAGHPREDFLEKCAPLVACAGTCVSDAGPWRAPVADYQVVSPEGLVVDSRAELLAREADGQRWVAVWITVRNPGTRAVRISATGEPGRPPSTFAIDVRGPTGTLRSNDFADDMSSLFFRANETRTRLFELRVASTLTGTRIPPGVHLLAGGYARRWSTYDTVVVAP